MGFIFLRFYLLPNEPPKMWNNTKNNVIGKIPITVHDVFFTRLQLVTPVEFEIVEQLIALSTAPNMNTDMISPTATPMNPMTKARFSIKLMSIQMIFNIKV